MLMLPMMPRDADVSLMLLTLRFAATPALMLRHYAIRQLLPYARLTMLILFR